MQTTRSSLVVTSRDGINSFVKFSHATVLTLLQSVRPRRPFHLEKPPTHIYSHLRERQLWWDRAFGVCGRSLSEWDILEQLSHWSRQWWFSLERRRRDQVEQKNIVRLQEYIPWRQWIPFWSDTRERDESMLNVSRSTTSRWLFVAVPIWICHHGQTSRFRCFWSSFYGYWAILQITARM